MIDTLFRNRFRVKSTRLDRWDYSSEGVYFVTVCTGGREFHFGNIENQTMQLSKIGEIAQQYWLEIPKHYSNVELDEFIIMPNHIHGIIVINNKNGNVETPHWGVSTMTTSRTNINIKPNQTKIGGYNPNWKPNSLGSIINQFKSICTKQIRKLYNPNFQWQSGFYDHIVRNEESLNEIREYIRNNPLKWGLDRNNPECKKHWGKIREIVETPQNVETPHWGVSTMKNRRGVVLILTFIIMATLTAIVVAFLSMTAIQTKGSGYDIVSSKALWLAEAGLQKAIWYLKTPIGSGGQGEDWTTTGVTENLGDGSYDMVVERWDFCLSANGSTVTASSSQSSNVPANAIDGSDSTYWQSQNKPLPSNPEEIIIYFPYTLAINKVRFLVPAGSSQQAPKDYTWQVSADNVTYTTVFSITGNSATDVTDTFSAVSNIKYLKLSVTKIGGGAIGVRIATLEAIGAKITSTGTVIVINRKIEQTVVADDATQTAYDEIDWNEIVPVI